MNLPRLSESAKERLSDVARFILIIPMFLFSSYAWGWMHRVWTDHWVLKDGVQVAAVVTHVGPRRVLDYRYTANGRNYTGRDARDWKEDRNHTPDVTETITARASASHPWLSLLDPTRTSWAGLPVAFLMSLFALLMLAILLDGIVHLIFGIRIHTSQPEDSWTTPILVSALAVLLLVTIFVPPWNRKIRFLIERGQFRHE